MEGIRFKTNEEYTAELKGFLGAYQNYMSRVHAPQCRAQYNIEIADKLDKAQSQAAVSQIIRDINEGESTD